MVTNALNLANERRWANAKLTRNFTGIAKALVTAKARYQAVEAKTGVPWHVIAVIHERESSQNWTCSLAQGDPIDRPSTHVPTGRGPFKSWEAAAIDTLTNCSPFLARKKDWSLGATLVNLELYNGAGYANRGRPSPYLWAGTDQYSSGKFVRDGIYDPAHVDSQPGCAGMLKAMMALDPSIKLDTAKPPVSTIKKMGGAVVAGGAAAGAALQAGHDVGAIIAIGVPVALAAFLIWRFKI
jgi:lysozyme family protein